jgi:hypothetical protein
MALGPEDISRARIGQLGSAGISSLRLIRDVFGVVFKLTPEAQRAPPEDEVRAAREAVAKARKSADGEGDFDDEEEQEGEGGKGGGGGKPASGGKRGADAVPVAGAGLPSTEIKGGHSGPTVLVSCLGRG